MLFVAFPAAAYSVLGFHRYAKLFPLVVSIPATGLMVAILVRDWFDLQETLRKTADLASVIRTSASDMLLGKTLLFYAWLLGILLTALAAGQIVSLPLFMAIYVLLWGRYPWKVALASAGCGLLVL